MPTNNPLNVSGVTSGGEDTTIPQSLTKSGLLLFSVTSNPSTGNDWANNIAIDSTYMYVVGSDNTSGDEKWRIEKRNLSDGALVSGFGTAGVIISDPNGGTAAAFMIAIDSTYMYVVGTDNSTGNYQWRIEKRNLSDGALVSGFGTGGVVTNDPSIAADEPSGIVIDSIYMYIVGYDNSPGNDQWRIEKRNLSDGALAAGFGTGGVVTNDPSTGNDKAFRIAIDSTYMYVVGRDDLTSPGYQWRIEKRNLSDGTLAASFGTAGVVTTNPGAGADDEPYGIAIDSTYMYVVGYDTSLGVNNQQWRIEKRLLSTGALDASFGTGGVATSNPSTGQDGGVNIAIDSTYMYVVGYDTILGVNNHQWRIEKRNLSDGALAAGFGTGGVVTNDPSTGVDVSYGIAIDSTYMYVIGSDNSPGNGQWRIEKMIK